SRKEEMHEESLTVNALVSVYSGPSQGIPNQQPPNFTASPPFPIPGPPPPSFFPMNLQSDAQFQGVINSQRESRLQLRDGNGNTLRRHSALRPAGPEFTPYSRPMSTISMEAETKSRGGSRRSSWAAQEDARVEYKNAAQFGDDDGNTTKSINSSERSKASRRIRTNAAADNNSYLVEGDDHDSVYSNTESVYSSMPLDTYPKRATSSAPSLSPVSEHSEKSPTKDNLQETDTQTLSVTTTTIKSATSSNTLKPLSQKKRPASHRLSDITNSVKSPEARTPAYDPNVIDDRAAEKTPIYAESVYATPQTEMPHYQEPHKIHIKYGFRTAHSPAHERGTDGDDQYFSFAQQTQQHPDSAETNYHSFAPALASGTQYQNTLGHHTQIQFVDAASASAYARLRGTSGAEAAAVTAVTESIAHRAAVVKASTVTTTTTQTTTTTKTMANISGAAEASLVSSGGTATGGVPISIDTSLSSSKRGGMFLPSATVRQLKERLSDAPNDRAHESRETTPLSDSHFEYVIDDGRSSSSSSKAAGTVGSDEISYFVGDGEEDELGEMVVVAATAGSAEEQQRQHHAAMRMLQEQAYSSRRVATMSVVEDHRRASSQRLDAFGSEQDAHHGGGKRGSAVGNPAPSTAGTQPRP
ncbi:hypothetical protein HDU82_001290, partial [Entophlyctis luteolus]